MRILLDECLPARLRRNLPGHDVQTVPQAGWASIKNGKLLRLIADSGKFDVFLTVDKNLPREQKIEGLPFAVVVLRAKSNRLADVVPFAPELFRRLSEFQPGYIYILSTEDSFK
jgi:predicted nuclease of predicted toxin-antitoxin system